MSVGVQLPNGYTVAHGDARLLDVPMLGLISSVQCPGSVIVQLLDAMRAIRAAGITVIGGFHSPVERECLELLLAGTQPVVLCQARPANRYSPAIRAAMNAGRLAILSPTSTSAPRVTRALAAARNEVVARLAAALFVPYAAPGGATEALVTRSLAAGKPVLALDDPANAALFAAGATPVTAATLPSPFADVPDAR